MNLLLGVKREYDKTNIYWYFGVKGWKVTGHFVKKVIRYEHNIWLEVQVLVQVQVQVWLLIIFGSNYYRYFKQ